MKKIGGTLLFSGIIMIIVPFLSLTIRGQQETDYITGVKLGIIACIIGLILISLKLKDNK